MAFRLCVEVPILQILPVRCEGLCGIEDAFGMPHRIEHWVRPNLFTGLH